MQFPSFNPSEPQLSTLLRLSTEFKDTNRVGPPKPAPASSKPASGSNWSHPPLMPWQQPGGVVMPASATAAAPKKPEPWEPRSVPPAPPLAAPRDTQAAGAAPAQRTNEEASPRLRSEEAWTSGEPIILLHSLERGPPQGHTAAYKRLRNMINNKLMKVRKLSARLDQVAGRRGHG